MKQRIYHRFFSTKRLIPAFAIILGWTSVAWGAAPPAPLTTLSAIHALTNDEASRALPVAFEATVTYYRGYERTLFVQDGDAAIYIGYPNDLKLVPGDRVLVRGKTQKSFNPIVLADSVRLLGRVALPKAEPATFDQMIRAETDCKLVTVRGVIRTADLSLSLVAPVHFMRMQLLMEGGYFNANVDSDDLGALEGLLDAEVELTGIASEEFDSKMHQTGILIHVQTLSDVRIIKRADSSPWALPITPMDRVITVFHRSDSTSRVRVHGTITYYLPGSAVVLQDGAKSIWIATQTHNPLRIGDAADATGFPDNHDGFLNLEHGEVRDTLIPAPVTPLAATWETMSPRGYDSPGHHDDLVSIEGRVETEVREASLDELVLSADGKLFSAIYRHPDNPSPSTRVIPLGSNVRVTGICVLEYSNAFTAHVPFNILLRSYDDIVIVARPSLINTRNLILVVGLLLALVFAAVARGWTLEHRVRRQTAALAARIEAEAALERQRSRILEDINGSRPLAEIIEEILEMVSSGLKGAPCWCAIADGGILGACPPEADALRVIRMKIAGRSGSTLGTLFAGLDPLTPPHVSEPEALSVGARLATLAIETRRLYFDLRRRSEFDLLTDIHNRFSLDKHLDARIAEARQMAGVFGLIYIDLDEFKQVNDLCGHQVGDLYLQEAALRMKRQLRAHDMLARLGGDEFAALVAVVHDRAEAEEIAHRLEHSFDEPFVIGEFVLHGSASVGIALYPQDAVTKDGLLSTADAAMYQAKDAKKQSGQALFVNQNPELTPKNQT
jgi:diguanylate cyclase (GGDEF)-like protein